MSTTSAKATPPYPNVRTFRPGTQGLDGAPAAGGSFISDLRQLDDHALARERRPILVSVGERPRAGFEALQRLVGVERLVVKEDQAAGADGPREGDCVFDARVTPADPLLVFVLEVLRVVQEQVDVVGDGRSRDPVARLIRDCPASAGS